MSRKTTHRQGGQTLIEFAIVLPVLILILAVILDLGRAIYYYSVITNVAREGARYGSVTTGATNAQIQAHAQTYAYGTGIQTSNITVSIVTTDVSIGGTTRPETNVNVSVSYDYVPITPFVDRLLSGGFITISSLARMGREY